MRNKKTLKRKAAEATKLLKLLANRNRLMVLCQLVDGEHSVNELLEYVDISQSALSQNLIKMKDDGLLRSRRQGAQIYYSMSDNIVHEILKVLYNYYCKD